MNKITSIRGSAVVVRGNDIDTDQIIPARFLKAITFEGIENYAFYDLRYTKDGAQKEHPFNDRKYSGANILIVNSNFGCGSSREHAPQTLKRHGIDAIIGESFAEIFAGNCTALGMPLLTLPRAELHEIQALVEEKPRTVIEIQIDERTVKVADRSYSAAIPKEMRETFLKGTWDNTDLMLSYSKSIEKTYATLPYLQHFKEYQEA